MEQAAGSEVGSEIDIKFRPGLGGKRTGSGRRRVHEEGKQQCLWLGTGPEAQSVLQRFKELERRAGFKQHKAFLSHLLATHNSVHEGQHYTHVVTAIEGPEASLQWSRLYPQSCTEPSDPSDATSALVSQNGLYLDILLYSSLLQKKKNQFDGGCLVPPIAAAASNDTLSDEMPRKNKSQFVSDYSVPTTAAAASDATLLDEMPRKKRRMTDLDETARAAAETLMELGGNVATHRMANCTISCLIAKPYKPCTCGVDSTSTCCPFTVVSGDRLFSIARLVVNPSTGLVGSELRDVSAVENCICVPADEVLNAVHRNSSQVVGYFPIVSGQMISQQGYMELSDGDQIKVEPSPGSMGQMDGTQGCGGGGGEYGGNFKKEQPSSSEEAFKLDTQKLGQMYSINWVGLMPYLLLMEFLSLLVSLQSALCARCCLRPKSSMHIVKYYSV